MKIRRHDVCRWVAFVLLGAMASGCGAKTVGSTDRAAAPEGVTVPSNTPASEVSAAVTAEPAPEPAAEPVVKRSERVLPALKPELQEVVRLVDTGVGEEVARAFVASSSIAYDLALDEIILLRDIGVPDGVIAAMMRRGGELRAQEAEAAVAKTNLVAAVEQLKDAMERHDAAASIADSEAGSAGVAPTAETLGQESAVPVPVAATQAPAEAPAAVQQFYGDLSPYGSWYQVPSHGWVWQPSVVVVNSTWAPYCHGGRWVWTNHGWYWNSDYSWGWAPFHYGRWATYPGLGWCWVPDTVWGPSWVTWRHSGSHIGWAPLPPACGWRSGVGLTWRGEGVSVGFGFGLGYSSFTFVESSSFCHRNVGHRAIRGGRAEHLYQNTTVVNNVIHGDNNTIVNNGVGYNNVASLTRGEVPKARVEPLPETTSAPARADRMERSKDGMVVYRPTSVEAAGGRPAALRAEVRPSNSTASGLVAGGRPARASSSSRQPMAASGLVSKPVDGRDPISSEPTSAGRPSSSSSRPVARPMSPSVASPSMRGPSGSTVGSFDSKGIETRSAGASTRPSAGTPAPVTRAPDPSRLMGGSTRATTPVPLADPSRNIPSRMQGSSTARPAVPVNPGKSTFEARGGYTAPSVAPNAGGARPSTSVAAPNRFVPQAASPSYQAPAPRSFQAPAAPKVDYSRGAVGAGSPSSSFSSPRPAVSAPAPQFSAPRAPAVTAPARVPQSAPAASAGPSAAGGRNGQGRTNPN